MQTQKKKLFNFYIDPKTLEMMDEILSAMRIKPSKAAFMRNCIDAETYALYKEMGLGDDK